MIRRMLLASVLAFAVGCGGGGNTTDAGSGGGSITGGGGAGGGGGSTGTVADVNAYCTAFSGSFCDNYVSCNLMESSFKNDCVTLFSDSYCAELRQSVASGEATFDRNESNACIQALQTAGPVDCADLFASLGGSCSSPIKGAVPTGGQCNSYGDCANSNDQCNLAADAGSSCDGVCQPYEESRNGALGKPCYGTTVNSCYSPNWCDVAVNLCKAPQGSGATCTSASSNECNDDNYCNTTTMQCTALPGAGAACDISNFPYCNSGAYCQFSPSPPTCVAKGNAGAACSSSTSCLDSLRCVNAQCQAPAFEGGACSGFGDCQQDLLCDDVSRTCQKPVRTSAGQQCSSTRYCGDGHCANKTVNPDGGVGGYGTCSTNYVGATCFDHYSCRNATNCLKQADAGFSGTGTCVTSTNGSPCDNGDNCPANHYCGSNGLCAPRVTAGGSCPSNSQGTCASPLVCVTGGADAGTGTCGVPGTTGATCAVGGQFQCKIPNECISGTCTLVGDNGQPCTERGTCYTGACVGFDPSTGARGTCGAKLADNQPCTDPFACVSGFCDERSGVCASVCQ